MIKMDMGAASVSQITDSVPMKGPSWVSMVKNKQVLKKYEVSMDTSEDLPSVVIPSKVIEDSTPLWEDFLVGKFLSTAPLVTKVHVIVNKLWKQVDEAEMIDVYEVNPTTMRFRVRDPSSRERIIRRGLWNIAGDPFVVYKWDPKTEEEKQEESDIPMWVYLKMVPLSMYSWVGLSFISSAAGFPVRLHPETLACTNLDTAKVFVKVDVSKELPKKINFTKYGKDFLVEFIYPWLPPRCNVCGKWGHSEKVCVAQQKQEEYVKEDKIEDVVASDHGPSRKSLVGAEADMIVTVSEIEDDINGGSSKGLSEEENLSSSKRKEVSEIGVDENWLSP